MISSNNAAPASLGPLPPPNPLPTLALFRVPVITLLTLLVGPIAHSLTGTNATNTLSIQDLKNEAENYRTQGLTPQLLQDYEAPTDRVNETTNNGRQQIPNRLTQPPREGVG